MDAKLPMDIFENVMQLATEGCKAVANYIREVRSLILIAYQVLVFKFFILFISLYFQSTFIGYDTYDVFLMICRY